MTPIVTLGLLVLLAQSPAAQGAPARYKITLVFSGVWGLVTDEHGSCPPAAPGADTLTGIVEGIEPQCVGIPCLDPGDDEGIRYGGRLTRTTSLGLCEAKDTPDGTEWCGGHLSGGGPFLATITVPYEGRDNESLGVVIEPDGMGVWATVSGSCSSLDNQAVADQYRSRDTIFFDTSDAPGSRVPPTGKLVVGTYAQTVTPPPRPGEYTLKVEPVP